MCNEYVDKNGHGNCGLTYNGEVGCYVEEPTSCSDTIASYGRRYSVSEACSTGISIINSKQLFDIFQE